MSNLIPLISQMNIDEETQWLAALSNAAPEFHFVPCSQVELKGRTQHEVAVVANPDPSDVATFSNLKWVQSLWAGVERIIQELPSDDLGIVRLVDPQLAQTMSEAVLAWTFYLHRDMPAYALLQNRVKWSPQEFRLAKERKICVLGLGELGEAAAKRLQANGFDVCGWSRSPKSGGDYPTFSGDAGLRQALGQSEIVIVLLPQTPTTVGLLDSDVLSFLPAGACIINFGRGPIIDDAALLAALDSGAIKHVVLDVFAQEPLPQDSAYWRHPSVTVLPHISAPTNMETAAAIVADNLRSYFSSGEMPNLVNRANGY